MQDLSKNTYFFPDLRTSIRLDQQFPTWRVTIWSRNEKIRLLHKNTFGLFFFLLWNTGSFHLFRLLKTFKWNYLRGGKNPSLLELMCTLRPQPVMTSHGAKVWQYSVTDSVFFLGLQLHVTITFIVNQSADCFLWLIDEAFVYRMSQNCEKWPLSPMTSSNVSLYRTKTQRCWVYRDMKPRKAAKSDICEVGTKESFAIFALKKKWLKRLIVFFQLINRLIVTALHRTKAFLMNHWTS